MDDRQIIRLFFERSEQAITELSRTYGNGRERRTEREQQLFNLDAGEDVDVVEGLVPDVQVRGLAQASRQQHLFLLSGGKVAHILFKLYPFKAQLAQDRLEKALVDVAVCRIAAQAAAQTGGVLRYIGYLQPARQLQRSGVWNVR